jgi:hypothetical protein
MGETEGLYDPGLNSFVEDLEVRCLLVVEGFVCFCCREGTCGREACFERRYF